MMRSLMLDHNRSFLWFQGHTNVSHSKTQRKPDDNRFLVPTAGRKRGTSNHFRNHFGGGAGLAGKSCASAAASRRFKDDITIDQQIIRLPMIRTTVQLLNRDILDGRSEVFVFCINVMALPGHALA
jgi:hypothetical protein